MGNTTTGSITYDGETFTWTLTGGTMPMLTVRDSGGDSRTTQLGGMTVEQLAEMLAFEIVGQRKPRPKV